MTQGQTLGGQGSKPQGAQQLRPVFAVLRASPRLLLRLCTGLERGFGARTAHYSHVERVCDPPWAALQSRPYTIIR